LLRGLARAAGHWGDFGHRLRQGLSDAGLAAPVVTVDLPGNGSLHDQPSPLAVSDMVEACRQALRERGIAGPVHVVAISLGGMVAAEWALRHPQELKGVVLINTSMKPFSPFFQRLKPTNYASLLAMSVWRHAPRWRERRILALTTRLQTDPERVLDEWVTLQRQQPVRGRNVLRQLLAAARYRSSRARPQVPMLLLCSKGDDLVDWRCSQHISRSWGVPLLMHPTAGHDLPLDDGAWVVAAMLDWVQKRRMLLQGGRRSSFEA